MARAGSSRSGRSSREELCQERTAVGRAQARDLRTFRSPGYR
ncbi:gas vesicle protein GvpC [Patescibacteria group bacterium]|nr:gas vesicle protein GvpC [Patescibacteria group bacterium]